MAAWRVTQGIYRFAPNLLDELTATSVSGELPSDLLRRLPEWCVYVELGYSTSIGVIHGVWARIGYDAETHEEELDLLLDVNASTLHVMRLPLVGTLEESLEVTRRDTRALARGNAKRLLIAEMQHTETRKIAEPVMSVILYLCSANSEIASSDRSHPRTRPHSKVLANGDISCPPANEPTIWATGTRLGSALRRARERTGSTPLAQESSVAPHIRRAHWHAYWLGAAETPERRRELRWLPPIPVNLDDDAPLLATLRPVPEPNG
ncbi:MAG: hypothetical protein QM831_43975 [Kofleriaceae bacterium]